MKKIFNLDVHISVILDIKNIIENLNLEIEIINWSISGHNWVLNKKEDNIKYLNNKTWTNLDIEMINNFQLHYDNFLKRFDAFIVCHPNSFILLFEKYNKPIYIINTCRYDLPFCWNNNHYMINEIHKTLIILQEKNLLHVISNNKADNIYFLLGNPTISTQILPSLCEYTNMLILLKNLLILYIVNLEKLYCRLFDLYDRGDQRN